MIKSVHFENFRVLRDSTLPLGRVTLIVGPNGSGKTTALRGMSRANGVNPENPLSSRDLSISAEGLDPLIRISIEFEAGGRLVSTWSTSNGFQVSVDLPGTAPEQHVRVPEYISQLRDGLQVYTLDAGAIAAPGSLRPWALLGEDGAGLVAVLDRLRDQHPERFDEINAEVGSWFPDFDRILFEIPAENLRAFLLRLRESQKPIRAADLSQGVLLALAIMTLAYLPDPPGVVCFEEPDRGLHPRLLRDVRDALYRLAYPENFGDKRKPVQVIATTHCPYMLDLFHEHPEEIVIANRVGDNVQFEQLSDRKDLDEILRDSHLGDAWYNGVLGGVPNNR
jgi:predicted ATPase